MYNFMLEIVCTREKVHVHMRVEKFKETFKWKTITDWGKRECYKNTTVETSLMYPCYVNISKSLFSKAKPHKVASLLYHKQKSLSNVHTFKNKMFPKPAHCVFV